MTTDLQQNIIERLRKTDANGGDLKDGWYCSPLEAATEIERLRAENAELRQKIEDNRIDIGSFFVEPGYGGNEFIWIGRSCNAEGGDFPVDDVAALIEKFYEERF
jgi:hypothetical protein